MQLHCTLWKFIQSVVQVNIVQLLLKPLPSRDVTLFPSCVSIKSGKSRNVLVSLVLAPQSSRARASVAADERLCVRLTHDFCSSV